MVRGRAGDRVGSAGGGAWGVKEALHLVTRELARPFEMHLPVCSLRAAAGKFGEGQAVEEEGWVEVPGMRLRQGVFVTEVVGKSIEPRIPDGSVCIFRAPIPGSRQGTIVGVQHHSIHCPETGGRYTLNGTKPRRLPIRRAVGATLA